jgi:flagellar biosynthesis GTPase FlhF
MNKWLFEENATYREVIDRCRKEFGVNVVITTVARYYQREFRARSLERFSRSIHEKKEILKIVSDKQEPQDDYELMLRMAETMAVEEALKPDKERDYRKVGYLARLIISAREEATSRMHADLALQKAQYDIATTCLMHKIKMDLICEETKDEREMIEKIREELFGPNLPK